ncbi:PREDICTED: caspase-1-like [Chrysochloris asiatica]|uniref:Caspase-1 n=1 Tax=Chrysochloris asiatica TaxID=185453 RepID=A0A9B0WHP6_CHRAS|nr:PREDICTED: caspase-1-like [Chrysochloris asiatica]
MEFFYKPIEVLSCTGQHLDSTHVDRYKEAKEICKVTLLKANILTERDRQLNRNKISEVNQKSHGWFCFEALEAGAQLSVLCISDGKVNDMKECGLMFSANRLKDKRKLFVQSVSEDTLNGLLDDLLSDKVLNQEEVEIVKKENNTTIAKARALMDFVIPKGLHANQNLIKHICERNITLAKKLGFPSAVSETLNRPKETASAESIDKLKLCSYEDFLNRKEKEKSGEIYLIKEKKERTRLALIICNTEFEYLSRRNGADHDIRGMKELLEGLNYTVQVEENCTARNMESILKAFATRDEHKFSDSTFLVFMSHGLLDKICGIKHSDENPDVLLYDTIFQNFNNLKCPNLRDKPKVIIIQACRGEREREAWVSDFPASSADSSSLSLENLQDDGVHKTHVEKDFVAFCSSTPHDVSWRSENGSVFIIQLINCFQNYSWCCHLIEIFGKVQYFFEKPGVKVQMPTIERLSMPKKFYLFPGN